MRMITIKILCNMYICHTGVHIIYHEYSPHSGCSCKIYFSAYADVLNTKLYKIVNLLLQP